MKLAHIVPTSLLAATTECDAFLCLSSLIVSNPKYAEFHARMAATPGKTVILDNPVHENGVLNLDHWVEAASLLQPTVAIIPDVIDDWQETAAYAEKFRHLIREVAPNTRLMGVPHGETHMDYMRCAIEMMQMRDPAIHWFGVSLERRLNDDALALQRRIRRVAMLQSEPSFAFRNIHLLGVSETAEEFTLPSLRGVRTADTSKFAVWWLQGQGTIAPLPPVPIKQPYPGRRSLGGSTEYFNYRAKTSFLAATLPAYLDAWSDYAKNGR